MFTYDEYKKIEQENEEELNKDILFQNIGVNAAKLEVLNIIDDYILRKSSNKDVNDILLNLKQDLNSKLSSLETKIEKSEKRENELDRALKQNLYITRIDVTKLYDKNTKKAFIFQNSYKNDINVEKIGYELNLDKSKVKIISLKELESIQKYYDNNKDNVLIANKSFKDADIANCFVDEIINNVQKENTELEL